MHVIPPHIETQTYKRKVSNVATDDGVTPATQQCSNTRHTRRNNMVSRLLQTHHTLEPWDIVARPLPNKFSSSRRCSSRRVLASPRDPKALMSMLISIAPPCSSWWMKSPWPGSYGSYPIPHMHMRECCSAMLGKPIVQTICCGHILGFSTQQDSPRCVSGHSTAS